MAFIQTSVPLVFWGRRSPAHEITCICRTEEKKGIATGSLNGQVCLWDICKERETEKVKVQQVATCILPLESCISCSLGPDVFFLEKTVQSLIFVL